jgi:hypothetical protein|tara:strand:+ start:1348 stop:1677 length:330 start_codon:yes stop_codon:yes gene_type:complete
MGKQYAILDIEMRDGYDTRVYKTHRASSRRGFTRARDSGAIESRFVRRVVARARPSRAFRVEARAIAPEIATKRVAVASRRIFARASKAARRRRRATTTESKRTKRRDA